MESAALARDDRLLREIKERLPVLEQLLQAFQRQEEDGVYRFYHGSFKVYQLQALTLTVLEQVRAIAEACDRPLAPLFQEVVAAGTGHHFELDHNRAWSTHTRPIVEAFWHAGYMLEMLVRYGRELDEPPDVLPSGWAAVLELFQQR